MSIPENEGRNIVLAAKGAIAASPGKEIAWFAGGEMVAEEAAG